MSWIDDLKKQGDADIARLVGIVVDTIIARASGHVSREQVQAVTIPLATAITQNIFAQFNEQLPALIATVRAATPDVDVTKYDVVIDPIRFSATTESIRLRLEKRK